MWLAVGLVFIASVMLMTWSLCKAASKEDRYIEFQYEKIDKNNKNI